MVFGRGLGAAFHASIYFVLSSVVPLANVSEVAWSQGVGGPVIIWRCLQASRSQGSRWFMGRALSSWVVSNIYVSIYFVSRSQGSRSSIVFGVCRKILLLTMSSVVLPAMVAKVGGRGPC